MDDTIRVFSGKTISLEDIETIKYIRKRFPKLNMTEYTATVCESLEWLTPAGRPKIAQCRVMLSQLEAEGVVKLPDLRPINKKIKKETAEPIHENAAVHNEITGEVKDFYPITVEIAKPNEDLRRWGDYIKRYHMLGYKQVFGSRLQYFIKGRDIELGCLQFSASAWSLAGRDKWIGWEEKDRKERLHLIINNSRYLIFPWVKIRNLASKALSIVSRQIQRDWLTEYCYAPVILETFVDTEHYEGTCYKAANWIYLGETEGRGRMDRYKERALSRKAIFMYPLQADFKECLLGKKPYKAVNPDEQ